MNNKFLKKTIAFFTLGCRTNQYDTEALKEFAQKRGYRVVSPKEKADIYVINSCAVTKTAITKSRRRINQAKAKNSCAQIVLTGCWPQVSKITRDSLPEGVIVSGIKDRKNIFKLLREGKKKKDVKNYNYQEKFEEGRIKIFSNRQRAIVKVQEGCRQFCSYCVIPYARGPLRSRLPRKAVNEIKRLIKNGYDDITLTGTHIGLYGADLKGDSKITLSFLVKEILKIEGLKYVRLSSIEPNEVTMGLVKLMREDKKFYPWFHIPLQSGSDRILKLMNRPYSTKKFEQKICSIRKNVPQVKITTDIIVGFPGEEEADFEDTYNFCKKLRFSKIHVFSFSPRVGTLAGTMPNQISKEVIKKRSKVLRDLSARLG